MMNKLVIAPSLLLAGCALLPGQGGSDAVQREYLKAFGPREQLKPSVAQQPDILLITSDQQIWDAIHALNSVVSTPNLDRLAATGTVYSRAYTCNPVSTPTRASMITGVYPSRHGAYSLGTKLPEDVPVIGSYLFQMGYSSHLIGKAHFMPLAGSPEYPSLEGYPILQDLEFWKRFHGPFYGFDTADLSRNHGDEGHVGQHYALWMMDKLRSEGRSPDEWRDWFSAPTHPYAVYEPVMDELTEDYLPRNPERQHGLWNCPEEYHLDAWIAETTIKRIEEARKKGGPYFAWASFFDPHPPYLVPAPWDTMYNPEDIVLPPAPDGDLDDMPYHYRMTQTRDKDWAKEFQEDGFAVSGFQSHLKTDAQLRQNLALYYGMISMMDKYIGKILDYLEDNGLLEKTLIVFTSDHGNFVGGHGISNKGGFAFEEGVRIPLIVSWKGHYPEGRKSDALFSIVDLAPTLLSAAGLPETPLTMSGRDASPLFSGQAGSYRDFVLIENHFQRTKFYQKAMVTDRYKIVWYMHSDEGELFDLQNDPGEHDNLWNRPDCQALKLRLLHEAMQAEMKEEICPMPRVAPA